MSMHCSNNAVTGRLKTQERKMEDQIRARANVNYWKMQDQKSDDAGREMQDQTESYLLIGAVAKRSGCISLAVVVVAVQLPLVVTFVRLSYIYVTVSC